MSSPKAFSELGELLLKKALVTTVDTIEKVQQISAVNVSSRELTVGRRLGVQRLRSRRLTGRRTIASFVVGFRGEGLSLPAGNASAASTSPANIALALDQTGDVVAQVTHALHTGSWNEAVRSVLDDAARRPIYDDADFRGLELEVEDDASASLDASSLVITVCSYATPCAPFPTAAPTIVAPTPVPTPAPSIQPEYEDPGLIASAAVFFLALFVTVVFGETARRVHKRWRRNLRRGDKLVRDAKLRFDDEHIIDLFGEVLKGELSKAEREAILDAEFQRLAAEAAFQRGGFRLGRGWAERSYMTLPPSRTKMAEELHRALDKDEDGVVSSDDLLAWLKDSRLSESTFTSVVGGKPNEKEMASFLNGGGVAEDEGDDVFAEAMTFGEGGLTENMFKSMCAAFPSLLFSPKDPLKDTRQVSREDIQFLFEKIDAGGDGYIDGNDLKLWRRMTSFGRSSVDLAAALIGNKHREQKLTSMDLALRLRGQEHLLLGDELAMQCQLLEMMIEGDATEHVFHEVELPAFSRFLEETHDAFTVLAKIRLICFHRAIVELEMRTDTVAGACFSTIQTARSRNGVSIRRHAPQRYGAQSDAKITAETFQRFLSTNVAPCCITEVEASLILQVLPQNALIDSNTENLAAFASPALYSFLLKSRSSSSDTETPGIDRRQLRNFLLAPESRRLGGMITRIISIMRASKGGKPLKQLLGSNSGKLAKKVLAVLGESPAATFDDQPSEFRRFFHTLDRDQDGIISTTDLWIFVKASGAAPSIEKCDIESLLSGELPKFDARKRRTSNGVRLETTHRLPGNEFDIAIFDDEDEVLNGNRSPLSRSLKNIFTASDERDIFISEKSMAEQDKYAAKIEAVHERGGFNKSELEEALRRRPFLSAKLLLAQGLFDDHIDAMTFRHDGVHFDGVIERTALLLRLESIVQMKLFDIQEHALFPQEVKSLAERETMLRRRSNRRRPSLQKSISAVKERLANLQTHLSPTNHDQFQRFRDEQEGNEENDDDGSRSYDNAPLMNELFGFGIKSESQNSSPGLKDELISMSPASPMIRRASSDFQSSSTLEDGGDSGSLSSSSSTSNNSDDNESDDEPVALMSVALQQKKQKKKPDFRRRKKPPVRGSGRTEGGRSGRGGRSGTGRGKGKGGARGGGKGRKGGASPVPERSDSLNGRGQSPVRSARRSYGSATIL